jgi:pimeloyl-ACP methyl ester carboxylesterase
MVLNRRHHSPKDTVMKTSPADDSLTMFTPAPDETVTDQAPADRAAGGRIGWIAAGSMATGLVAAALLGAAPFVRADVDGVMGAVLCGLALGWAMLAVLSARLTDWPQRWAAAPAVFMALGGLLLVAFGSSVRGVLDWVWPAALLAMVIWMTARVRRQLRSRGARWLVYSVFAVLTLASVGGGYEAVSEAADAENYPMPGQLIDVGGHSLHLNCTGSGSPTVVLEAGGGEMSSSFGWIAPEVSGATRVCVYDRAGHGWSEPADTPQDGERVATDLHTLLRRAQVSGPYVMAGHSFGGLYVLAFADRYPDEVAGMVLVDSTAPKTAADLAVRSADGGSYKVVGRLSALVASTARFGVGRLIGLSDFASLPPRSRDELRAATATENHVRGTIEEYLTATASMGQAASLDAFADRPLVVLTAGSGSDAAWIAAHDDLATLSTDSEHRTIDGATHSTLIHDEKDARATSGAILDVVASVRQAVPLNG